MSEISKRQWNRWAERALTIKLKAEELQSQMFNALGADDYATDMGDNLTTAAEEALAHLERRRDQSQ